MSKQYLDDARWPFAGRGADNHPARELIGYGAADPEHLNDESLARLAKTMIGRHVARLASAEHLADILSVQVDRLESAFAFAYGIQISTGINREKLRQAQRLLVQTSLGLPTIAAQVGYRHPSYFVLAFREHVGISPWSFRQLPYAEQMAAIECFKLG